MNKKIIATNRKAKFEYFLLEHFEAGIALKGSEIKSIRAGHVSLAEAYVQNDGKNSWLMNAHIAPYEPASRENHDPKRSRRLLLNKKENKELREGTKLKGLAIIPVEIYLRNGLAKLDIALGKGKKLYDKRSEIAKKEMKRDLERLNKKND